MEPTVKTDIQQFSVKNEIHKELFIPYHIQCAFIRIFVERYPDVRKFFLLNTNSVLI